MGDLPLDFSVGINNVLTGQDLIDYLYMHGTLSTSTVDGKTCLTFTDSTTFDDILLPDDIASYLTGILTPFTTGKQYVLEYDVKYVGTSYNGMYFRFKYSDGTYGDYAVATTGGWEHVRLISEDGKTVSGIYLFGLSGASVITLIDKDTITLHSLDGELADTPEQELTVLSTGANNIRSLSLLTRRVSRYKTFVNKPTNGEQVDSNADGIADSWTLQNYLNPSMAGGQKIFPAVDKYYMQISSPTVYLVNGRKYYIKTSIIGNAVLTSPQTYSIRIFNGTTYTYLYSGLISGSVDTVFTYTGTTGNRNVEYLRNTNNTSVFIPLTDYIIATNLEVIDLTAIMPSYEPTVSQLDILIARTGFINSTGITVPFFNEQAVAFESITPTTINLILDPILDRIKITSVLSARDYFTDDEIASLYDSIKVKFSERHVVYKDMDDLIRRIKNRMTVAIPILAYAIERNAQALGIDYTQDEKETVATEGSNTSKQGENPAYGVGSTPITTLLSKFITGEQQTDATGSSTRTKQGNLLSMLTAISNENERLAAEIDRFFRAFDPLFTVMPTETDEYEADILTEW